MTISVEGKRTGNCWKAWEISGKSDLVNDGKTVNSQLDYFAKQPEGTESGSGQWAS